MGKFQVVQLRSFTEIDLLQQKSAVECFVIKTFTVYKTCFILFFYFC